MGAFLFRIYNFIQVHIWFIDMRTWDWKVYMDNLDNRNEIFTYEFLLTWRRRYMKVKVRRRFLEVNWNFVEKFWEARDRNIFHWPRGVILSKIMDELLHLVLSKLLNFVLYSMRDTEGCDGIICSYKIYSNIKVEWCNFQTLKK